MNNKLPETRARPLHTTTNILNLAFRPAHTIHYCHRHPERRSSRTRSNSRPETTTFFLSNRPLRRQSGLRMSSLGFPESPRSKRTCSGTRCHGNFGPMKTDFGPADHFFDKIGPAGVIKFWGPPSIDRAPPRPHPSGKMAGKIGPPP